MQSSVSALAISTICCSRDRQVADQSVRRDVAQAGKHLARFLPDFSIVHPEGTPPVRRCHEDVLGHRHVAAKRDLLVHETDAKRLSLLGRADLGQLAADADFAAVGRQDAVDDVHQGGFAGAILARQGMHLACAQHEVDILQGLHRSECLADPTYFQ